MWPVATKDFKNVYLLFFFQQMSLTIQGKLSTTKTWHSALFLKVNTFPCVVLFDSWTRGGGAYPGAECRSRERAESQRLHAPLHGGAGEPRQCRQVPAEQRRKPGSGHRGLYSL